MPAPQTLKNHARFYPLFHFFILPLLLLLLNVIFSIYVTVHTWPAYKHTHLWGIVIAVILFTIAGVARGFALRVQDRVIRLEERLRLQALAPEQWHAQIYRLSEDQVIALRFAADDEVVELAKQALEHKLSRKQIKERIKVWRADNWRV
jgi:hypothetical protein